MLKQIVEHKSDRKQKQEDEAKAMLERIRKANKQTTKEDNDKLKLEKKKSKSRGLAAEEPPTPRDLKSSRVALNNLLKLKSANDYNVTLRSESKLKKKKSKKSQVQTPRTANMIPKGKSLVHK